MITWIPYITVRSCLLQIYTNLFKRHPHHQWPKVFDLDLVPFFQKKFANIPIEIFEEAVCERLEPSIDQEAFVLEGDDLLTRCKKKMAEKGLKYIQPIPCHEWYNTTDSCEYRRK